MKLIIILILSCQLYASSLERQILKNRSSLSSYKVKKLALAFEAASRKYEIPANVLAAIAAIESHYVIDAVNKHSNDFGIMQVNEYNIRHYNFSKKRLLRDLNYSVECGAKVFSWFYKTYPTLKEAVKRYNCGTAKDCVNWKPVKHYYSKFKKAL